MKSPIYYTYNMYEMYIIEYFGMYIFQCLVLFTFVIKTFTTITGMIIFHYMFKRTLYTLKEFEYYNYISNFNNVIFNSLVIIKMISFYFYTTHNIINIKHYITFKAHIHLRLMLTIITFALMIYYFVIVNYINDVIFTTKKILNIDK
jgi:hypothetical protein